MGHLATTLWLRKSCIPTRNHILNTTKHHFGAFGTISGPLKKINFFDQKVARPRFEPQARRLRKQPPKGHRKGGLKPGWGTSRHPLDAQIVHSDAESHPNHNQTPFWGVWDHFGTLEKN